MRPGLLPPVTTVIPLPRRVSVCILHSNHLLDISYFRFKRKKVSIATRVVFAHESRARSVHRIGVKDDDPEGPHYQALGGGGASSDGFRSRDGKIASWFLRSSRGL